MGNLPIKSNDGVLVVSSRDVAEGLNIQHKNLLETIDKYLPQIEASFGRVAFETDVDFQQVTGQVRRMGAFLTEEQAIFIGTLSRNTPRVIEFKVTLVKSFSDARTNSIAIPKTFAQALMLAAKQQEEIERQAAALEAAQPKVDFYDAVTESEDVIPMGEVAKVLNFTGIGRNKLFEILRQEKVLMDGNVPYQAYVNLGWFRSVERKWHEPDGTPHITLKTVVYQKGVDGIRKVVKKWLGRNRGGSASSLPLYPIA